MQTSIFDKSIFPFLSTKFQYDGNHLVNALIKPHPKDELCI
jgi:hypothetical protein